MRRGWRQALIRILAYTVIGVAMLKFDPLGFDTVSGRLSEDIFNKLLAPKYGAAWLGGSASGAGAGADAADGTLWNRHITVLLLDDTLLKRQNLSWPVPFAFHADQIQDLFETYRPNAIMIDILFMDRRPGQEAGLRKLRDVLARINASGTPDTLGTRVFLAGDTADPRRSAILAELAREAELVPVRWPVKTGVQRSPQYYPLATGAGSGPNPFAPGPAYAIYRHLCETVVGPARDRMNCPADSGFGRRFQNPMNVFWGVEPPDLNWEQGNLGIHCRATSPSVIGRLWNYVIHFMTGSLDAYRQTCPYAQLIKLRDFADPDFRALKDVREAFRAALGTPDAGGDTKVVFYGASLIGAEDLTDTPTHGRIPGVHVHAMALDNLLTFGADYIRTDAGGRRLMYIEILLVFLIAAVSVTFRDLRPASLRDGEDGPWTAALRVKWVWWSLLFATAIYLIILMFMFFTFFVMHLSPINWLGFLGVTVLVKTIDGQKMENAAKRIVIWMTRRRR